MRTEKEIRNRRLIEALDHIDGKYIDEALDCIYAPPRGAGYVKDPRTNFRVFKQLIIAAACLLLLTAMIPATRLVLQRAGLIPPAGVIQETTDTDKDQDRYENYILTSAELQRINKIWEKYQGEKFADTPEEAALRWEYRGKYGDCIILRAKRENETESGYSIIAGNYRFSCDGGTYYVCRDFDVCTLLYAYEYGLLNDLQVQRLNEYHVKLEGSDSGGYIDEREYICSESVPLELSFEAISDIVHAHFKKMVASELNRPADMYSQALNDSIYYVRCYAEFGNAYVIDIGWVTERSKEQDKNTDGKDGYVEYVDGEYKLFLPALNYDQYLIDGVPFKAYNSDLCVYKSGEFYSLEQAYDMKIYDRGELEDLAKLIEKETPKYPRKLTRPIDTQGELDMRSVTVTIMPYAYEGFFSHERFSDIGCTEIKRLESTDKEFFYPAHKYKLTFPAKSYSEFKEAFQTLALRSDIYIVEANYLSHISEEEFLDKYVYPGCEYYGKYGNCYVILSHDWLDGEFKLLTIGEYTFGNIASDALKVFYNGEYIKLTDAYEKGYISDSDLEEIYNYHMTRTVPVVQYTCHGSCSISEEEAIKVVNILTENKLPCSPFGDLVYIEFFGKDGETYAYRSQIGADLMVYHRRIKGFNFIDASVSYILILHKGKAYYLKEAFEQGIISEEFLEEIYINHGGNSGIDTYGFETVISYNDFYFGEFNGAHVISYGNNYPASMKGVEKVGKYTFDYDKTERAAVIVYYNSEFISLSEAYRLKLISDSELDKIYDDFTFFNSIKLPESQYLWRSNTSNREFIRAIVAHKGGYKPGELFDFVTYGYGTFWVSGGAPKEHYEFISRYEFKYATEDVIEILIDGKIYTLNDAYDKGLVDDTTILRIYQKHQKQHPELYD